MHESVFISYASVDADAARQIASLLNELDINYFLDEKAIHPGDSVVSSVLQGVKECSTLIVILSPAVDESKWVLFEVGQAVALEKRIIPYLTHPVQRVPSYLHDYRRATNLSELRQFFQHSLELVDRHPPRRPSVDGYILTVGGGNREYTLKLSTEFEIGRKHIAESKSLLGGSGVNYTLRLLHTGYPVIPIISIGQDDVGREIQDSIVSAARYTKREHEISAFVGNTDTFFVPDATTARSTILVGDDKRTIVSEGTSKVDNFFQHLNSQIESLPSDISSQIRAVMIGHIRADRKGIDPVGPGRCTSYLIDRFSNQVLLFANFGDSQIRLGYDFWRERIHKLSVLQMNLDEMKLLFTKNGRKPSLTEIVDYLIKDRLTAIITLDKFGAICTFKESPDNVIIAWPFQLNEVVDATGAGDAFGAGLVSQLMQEKDLTFGHLFNAINEARFWAAYACCHLGGSAECPTSEQLWAFRKKLSTAGHRSVQIKDKEAMKDFFHVLDQVYD